MAPAPKFAPGQMERHKNGQRIERRPLIVVQVVRSQSA
jgi:hypothetical protein